MGELVSVNVGELRTIVLGGKPTSTGIYKQPVEGPVRLADDRVEGDAIGNPKVHGGRIKAVYAYAAEDYEWWSSERGGELEPGAFGENLTTRGLEVSGALVGERWRIGEAMLEVTEPRQPCAKLGHKLGDQRFVKRFLRELRLGAYLRIVVEGEVEAGATVQVIERPDHGVTVRTIGELLLGDSSRAADIAALPTASPALRKYAAQRA